MANRVKYLPTDEIAMFCEQVAMLLKSGIALYDGIEALCQNYAQTRYGDKFDRLNETMKRTGSLYEAVRALEIFPPYLVEMVRIGEEAGTLERVMQGLAQYYTREYQVRVTIRNAVTYPLLMVALMAVVVAVLVVQVLPMFSEVLRNLGGDLPASVAARMNAGMGAGALVLILMALVLLVVMTVALMLRTSKRERVLSFLQRTIRPLRFISDKLAAGRFASVMAMLIGSGFPLEQALKLVPGALTSGAVRDRVERIHAQVEAGRPFADAVEEARLFEPVHSKMIRVGYLTGQTETVMERLSAQYQEVVDDAIRRLVSSIEPTLVAVLSIVIGGILLAVILPLASLMSSLG